MSYSLINQRLMHKNKQFLDKVFELTRKEWEGKLYMMPDRSGGVRPSNRLAVVFLILFHFVYNINEQYDWKNIQKSVKAIFRDKEYNAELLGFADLKTARSICKKE